MDKKGMLIAKPPSILTFFGRPFLPLANAHTLAL